MGKSKSYRNGPGWQSRNTPGAATKASRGAVVHAEGTHMSGSDEYGRGGMGKSARSKSKAGRMPAKNSSPYGRS